MGPFLLIPPEIEPIEILPASRSMTERHLLIDSGQAARRSLVGMWSVYRVKCALGSYGGLEGGAAPRASPSSSWLGAPR